MTPLHSTAFSNIEKNFAEPSPQLYLALAAVNRNFRGFFLSDPLWEKFNVYGLKSSIAEHYLDICRNDVEQRKLVICSKDVEQHKPEERQYCTTWFETQLQNCSNDTEFRSYFMRDDPLDLYSQLEYLGDFENLTDERVTGFNKTVWVLWKGLLTRKTQIYGTKLRSYMQPYHIPEWLYADRDAYMDLARCIVTILPPQFRSDKQMVLTSLKAISRSMCDRHKNRHGVCDTCFYSRKVFVRDLFEYDLIDQDFRCDKDIMLAAIACSDDVLRYASMELKNDKEFIKAAVAKRNVLAHASPELRNDPEVILTAVKYDFPVIYSPMDLASDRYSPLKFASSELKSNKSFVLQVVTIHGQSLPFVSPELQDCEEVVLAAVSSPSLSQFEGCPYGSTLSFASQRLRNNRDIVLAAVSRNGASLRDAAEELRDCNSIVEAAVRNNGTALEYASPRLQGNRDIVLAAVSNVGCALEFAAMDWRHDRKIVLAAVSTNSPTLEFVPDYMQNDREIVLAAVSNCKNALRDVWRTLRDDKDIVLAAVSKSGIQLRDVCEHLRDDEEVVLAAVREEGCSLREASLRLRQNSLLAFVATMDRYSCLESVNDYFGDSMNSRLAVMRRRRHELMFANQASC